MADQAVVNASPLICPNAETLNRNTLNLLGRWPKPHATINMTMRYAHLAPGSGAHFIKALDGNPCQICGKTRPK